jgi:chromosomal replication initiation ATPase DnaA
MTNFEQEIAYIFDAIEKETGLTRDDLRSTCRIRGLVIAREIFSHIAKEYISLPVTQIGKILYRKHSTILNLLKCYDIDIETDSFFNVVATNIVKNYEEQKHSNS